MLKRALFLFPKCLSPAREGLPTLLGCELIIVAFRSAKVASVSATFAEQKATILATPLINSQPIREGAV